MSYSVNICLICLEHSTNLLPIKSQDTNGTSIEDKLKYFLPEHNLNIDIPRYICSKCGNNLSKSYEFKQKCLQNITIYEKYAQQITTIGHTYNDENIYGINTNSEINKELVKNEEFIIKEETNENLVSSDKLKSLCEIKQENSDSEDTFNKNVNIVENIQISSGNENSNEYVCHVCHETYLNEENLESHSKVCQNSQHSEKLYNCEVCNKSFRSVFNLKRHKTLHTGERPYTCEVCNKSFRSSENLKQHETIHTGERPFTCKICEKTFGHSGNLRRHQFIHTGEKPFTCEVCNKSFRQIPHLKKHRSTHL